MKYTEQNIASILFKINQLDADHGIKRSKAFLYLEREIDRHNTENPHDRIRRVVKSTFYDRLKNRTNLSSVFEERAFRILLKYLEDRGVCASATNNQITGLYSATSHFADITDADGRHCRDMLPGFYRTYRPAIGKPGHAVVGILEVIKDPSNKAVETFEIMLYQPRLQGGKRPRHEFKGMAWYSRGHYLILSTDSNTRFMQTVVLRSIISDAVEQQLEGAYVTVTNKGGPNIVCSKIVLERLHCTPGSGAAWRRVLRETIGYKHPEHENPAQRISRSIWQLIDPEHPSNLIRL
jgi:hypothetical protein